MYFNKKSYIPIDAVGTDHIIPRANGYYRAVIHGIELYTLEGKLTALLHARGYILEAKVHRGNTRYLMGATSDTRGWLGLSLTDKSGDADSIHAVMRQVSGMSNSAA